MRSNVALMGSRHNGPLKKLIDSYVAKVTGGGANNIDNQTRDCLGDIAKLERKRRLIPARGEGLSDWEKRPDIPKEWLLLKDHIKGRIGAKCWEENDRQQAVLRQQREKDRQHRLQLQEKRDAETRRQLLASNMDLIEKFLQIAERKVSIIDDYGEENWDALPQEIETCLTKIAKRKGADVQTLKKNSWNPPDYRWLWAQLEAGFREHHRKQKTKPASSYEVNGLSGVEFETWVARLLMEKGFEVRGTPPTGDQGADLIAKKDGRTIIIQAKRYQGTVGNKAVQEAIGALTYYGGDEGWVITNSSFTPSAKALAQKSRIKLIDGTMLNTDFDIASLA
jgi:hypothetical protein